jgi:hypothetical protein
VTAFEKSFHISTSHQARLLNHVLDAIFSVLSAPHDPAGAAGLTPGRCQRAAVLWILCLVKDSHTQTLDFYRFAIPVILQYGPPDRSDTDIQT